MKHVGKILLYGILFNVIFVGVPFCIDALKADIPQGMLTRQVDEHLQAEFARYPAESASTGTVAMYSMLVGWIAICGMFIEEARRIG